MTQKSSKYYLSVLSRLFFTSMFLLVVFLSAYFISNVWNKWNASPIIITQSAVATSVKDLPFPGNSYYSMWWYFSNRSALLLEAVTICNMNQVQKSAVHDIPHGSEEYSVVRSICRNSVDEDIKNAAAGKWSVYRKVLLNVCS